jgi:prolyl-tRNA editing enzyme YbaK/EbsC (Cys-tRNA(Pro) deacylase)
MRIFLSHSGRDKALVREIAGYFPPWLKTWIDEDRLLLGSELAASLEGAINSEVDYVVLLFGKEAAESGWVRREISWALQREAELERTFLLPVLLDDIRERLSEFSLAGCVTLQITDFTAGGTRLLAEQLVNHIGGWMSERLAVTPKVRPSPVHTSPVRPSVIATDSLREVSEVLLSLIAEIPASWQLEVESLLIRPFVDDVAAARIGIVPLTPAQYYHRVLTEMSRADSTTRILAVSTLSSDLWSHDVDQMQYAVRNFEAVKRGALIERLFVLPETQALSFADKIRLQVDAGVDARVCSTSLLAHTPDLEDFVLFEATERVRAYVAQPSIDGSRRIRSGALILSDHALARKRNVFQVAWELASTPAAFFGNEGLEVGPQAVTAPGIQFHSHRVASPVVTCEEAARARNIPLAQELKTLLLQTHHGIVAAHLPGDGTLSLRKVKARLETAEAYLSDPEDLLALGLSAGTVCAVLEPVWSMPHLISRRLLSLSTVMTNNGTRTGYFEFSPGVLTEAADVIVDDFET